MKIQIIDKGRSEGLRRWGEGEGGRGYANCVSDKIQKLKDKDGKKSIKSSKELF